jgi:glycosyltransferase involved in cell wall biosynthesis
MKTRNKSLLSVVIPAYNEASSLPSIIAAVTQYSTPLFDSIELIIVNDGSKDDTQDVLLRLARQDARIKPVNFSRNFGKEAALEAGLDLAAGDAVLFIDADLQHPPSLIPTMVGEWRKGASVVNAKKRERGKESMMYRLAAKLFYGMFASAAGVEFRGASDFKLLDREVVDAVKLCPERGRFFRGLVAWVGFNQVDVPFDVQPRSGGTTSWSTFGLIKYSIRNLITFSSLPLTLIAVGGFVSTLLSFALIVQTLISYLLRNPLSGFTTVIVAESAFSGVVLFAIGVIALYVGRIYEEQKARPLYIIKTSPSVTKVNTEEQNSHDDAIAN